VKSSGDLDATDISRTIRRIAMYISRGEILVSSVFESTRGWLSLESLARMISISSALCALYALSAHVK